MAPSNTLLITGGSGLLGSNIVKLASSRYRVYATYCSHPTDIPGSEFIPLDVTDRESTLSIFREIRPGLAIHAAALARVDYCEEQPQEAQKINVEGTENVAMAARETGTKLIYISTDSVFDGECGMYGEEAAPHPINNYARTKLAGEKTVQHLTENSIIVRTAFYGWSLRGQTSIAEWVVGNLRAGNSLGMFTDVFFSPIFVGNLAEALIEMGQRNLSGAYHVTGSERCSKYDFGQALAEAFGFDRHLVHPTSITEASLTALRPRDISLAVNKVSAEIYTPLLGLKEGVEQFKEQELEINARRERQCVK